MKKTKLQRLIELRNYCAMERFGASTINVRLTVNGQEADPTDYIKDATRIYRESWILPIVDELIAAARKKVAG